MRVFSNDTWMEFGVEKFAVLTMKNGKMANSDGTALPSKTMKELKEGDSYKYLGVIPDGMKHHEMKEKVKTEYYRRVRKILKMLETKLNGGNIITGINTWAISLLRYSAAFLDWIGTELEQMDRTRKLMTMHQALNPKSDVSSFYLSRKEGGRALINVEDTVKLAVLGLERYILTSDEGQGLLRAARRVDGDYEQHLEMIRV